jgi:hypothetical protein
MLWATTRPTARSKRLYTLPHKAAYLLLLEGTYTACGLYSLRQQAAYLLLLAAVELAREGHVKLDDEVASAARLLADGHSLTPVNCKICKGSSSIAAAEGSECFLSLFDNLQALSTH